MAALTQDRSVQELTSGGKSFHDPVAAGARLFKGALVGLDAAGNAVPAAPAVPILRGVAQMAADNRDGAAGAISVPTKRGAFHFNQTGLDRTHIGSDVFVVDDQTVSNAGTLVAGKLLDIDAGGAWVEIL